MSKKKLIIILSLLSVAAVTAAFYYYDSLNGLEDPRMLAAKKIVAQFEKKKGAGSDQELLALLDQASEYYQKIDGYKDSYELGVFANDRAAIFINSALYKTKGTIERLNKLRIARSHCQKAISIYKNWKKKYGGLKKVQMQKWVAGWMLGDKFVDRRVRQLLEAQVEVDRRLSVVYTNHGIVQRHLGETDGAAKSYITAIKLWPENQTAENNLRVLAGKDAKKLSIIRKLFPPKRLPKK